MEDNYEFINSRVFSAPMDDVCQLFKTCLRKCKKDPYFEELRQKIAACCDNEIISKANAFYEARRTPLRAVNKITEPITLIGDASEELKKLPENSVQLLFTSPPYYNAREYSNYPSYKAYLAKMKEILLAVHRVLEDGRFAVINVSPVIMPRLGREFESIRYPIHYDFHKILSEAGFYFIDEIIWIKPEPSVPDRISGYRQTRKPLSYKPNCITESIMVYRKNANFLLDKNMKRYKNYDRREDEPIDTSNCWYIAPAHSKKHPAVFPEELVRRVLKYYSFEGDAVLDCFAGSGTTGRVAKAMGRVPILCDIKGEYLK